VQLAPAGANNDGVVHNRVGPKRNVLIFVLGGQVAQIAHVDVELALFFKSRQFTAEDSLAPR
jgi:hypothetical protein